MSARPVALVPDPVRVIVIACPDWSVRAAEGEVEEEGGIIVADRGAVVGCSPELVDEGVRVGQRVRGAQRICPGATVLAADAGRDERAFEPVLAAIEGVVPGVQALRPGVAAVRARGAARFYGGEESAALALLEAVAATAVGEETRAAVADGPFCAELTATGWWGQEQRCEVVPVGASAAHLAPLSVKVLESVAPGLPATLRPLGLTSVGRFAALPRDRVHQRFGPLGLRAHQLAHGWGPGSLSPRHPESDHGHEVIFEPPAAGADEVVAGVTPVAESMISGLGREALVCSRVRVGLRSDAGTLVREWRHPWQFTVTDVVNRVRWQLEEWGEQQRSWDDEGLSGGLVAVQIAPTGVDPVAAHSGGLWGAAPEEHVVTAVTALQDRLGHRGVLVGSVAGGRLCKDRRVLSPFGVAPPPSRERDRPWPGAVPGPAPATVFGEPRPVAVWGPAGERVTVGERGLVSAEPSWLGVGSRRVRVVAWAGPWPVHQRWWSNAAISLDRFQVLDEQSVAWLLALVAGTWWAEARYD